MKKTRLLISCLALGLALSACGNKDNKESSASDSKVSQESSNISSESSKPESESSSVESQSSENESSKGGQESAEKKPSNKEKKPEESAQAKTPKEQGKIGDVMNKITKGAKIPSADLIQLKKSNFKDYSFIPWMDGIEAVASESNISASAHSMVLIRTKNGNGAKIAKLLADKADAKKWICVEAEVAKVLYTDDYVLMAMTFKDAFNKVASNFENLVGKDQVKSMNIKSAGK